MARTASTHVEASGRQTQWKSRRVFDETDGQKGKQCYDPVLNTKRIVHMTLFYIHGFLLPAWQTTTGIPAP